MSPGEINFDDLLLVMVVAVGVPLLLGLVPRVPIPSSVLEIAAAQIGVSVHALKPINAASLVAAGMLSVLLFPALALRLLQRGSTERPGAEPDERAIEGM